MCTSKKTKAQPKAHKVVCFHCSRQDQLLLFKKKITDVAKRLAWKKNDDVVCCRCGSRFYFDGKELIYHPCGECEEHIRAFMGKLMDKGEHYNHSNDRLCCSHCGHLYRLRNNKLVPAPIIFEGSLRVVEEDD